MEELLSKAFRMEDTIAKALEIVSGLNLLVNQNLITPEQLDADTKSLKHLRNLLKPKDV